MNEIVRFQDAINRRTFLTRSAAGIGLAALAELLIGKDALAQSSANRHPSPTGGLPGLPHFAPKAKRIIYLFQSGAPSQMELFDYKPELLKYRGQNLPDSVRNGQRLTGMTSGQG